MKNCPSPNANTAPIKDTAIRPLHLAKLAEVRVTPMLQYHLPGNLSQCSDAYWATYQDVLFLVNLLPSWHL